MTPFAAFGSEVRKNGNEEDRRRNLLPSASDLLLFLTS